MGLAGDGPAFGGGDTAGAGRGTVVVGDSDGLGTGSAEVSKDFVESGGA